jgi:hypothetical protein
MMTIVTIKDIVIFNSISLGKTSPTLANFIKAIQGKNRRETCRILSDHIIPLMRKCTMLEPILKPLENEFNYMQHQAIPAWHKEITVAAALQYLFMVKLCWDKSQHDFDYDNFSLESLQALHPWILHTHLEEMFCIKDEHYVRIDLKFFTSDYIVKCLNLILELIDFHYGNSDTIINNNMSQDIPAEEQKSIANHINVMSQTPFLDALPLDSTIELKKNDRYIELEITNNKNNECETITVSTCSDGSNRDNFFEKAINAEEGAVVELDDKARKSKGSVSQYFSDAKLQTKENKILTKLFFYDQATYTVRHRKKRIHVKDLSKKEKIKLNEFIKELKEKSSNQSKNSIINLADKGSNIQ